MSSPCFNTIGRRGFTLPEALASLLIISVLLAVLLPVLRTVAGHSRESICVQNLRTLSAALLTFSYEQGGVVVTKTDGSGNDGLLWSSQLYERGYVPVKKTFYCPGWRRKANDDAINWRWYTYGLNIYDPRGVTETVVVDADAGRRYRVYRLRLALVDNPSHTPMLMDSWSRDPENEKGTQSFRVWSSKGSSTDGSSVHLRHRGRAYISFFDGHILAADIPGIRQNGFTAYADDSGTLVRGLPKW